MKKTFTILFFLLLLSTSLSAQSKLRDFGAAPEFTGVDSNGNTFESSSKFKDHISIVNFFFTSCEGPCPSLMLKIKKIAENTKCQKIQFASISVDPETDTVNALHKYKVSRGLENANWSLLNVEEGKVIDLLNNGYKLGSGGDIINHSTRIVVIDDKNRIRALVAGMDELTIKNVENAIDSLCQ